ncbi:32 kDa beta-galactoside-binding lectin lec-3-like [Watersipora subatra]|uniref:32 kDa beta-galactoside-binding lectin lec-3-like n=1 Tax=Watersipora subatra TaxID=2589382 RepID=UPI00355B495C
MEKEGAEERGGAGESQREAERGGEEVLYSSPENTTQAVKRHDIIPSDNQSEMSHLCSTSGCIHLDFYYYFYGSSIHRLEVYVNGAHFCNYDHRVDIRSVSHIYIDGDAKFTDVEFTAYFGARYNSIIPQELIPGSWVNVTVAVHDNPHRFDVNLACDASDEERQLHFNPRFYEGETVRNFRLGGEYGEEERKGGFPFEAGKVYKIGIQVQDDYYSVYVNGEPYVTYNHRCDAQDAHHLTVNGDVSVLEVRFFGSLEDNSYRKVPGLKSGDIVTVIGSVKDDLEKICINLQGKTPDESSSSSDEEEKHTDIPLHFNPRWDQGEIVLNTLNNGDWEDEEIYPMFILFSSMFSSMWEMMIYVNGEYLANYEHRIKSKKVRFINLAGTAIFSSVKHVQGAYYVSDSSFLFR